MAARIAINRKEHFNAAHRLHNPTLSDDENRRIYGKCNNKNYHGHNYELIVRVAGDLDEQTGYLIDTKQLSDIISINVLDVFDHKKIDIRLDVKIILYETERNFVEYPA